MSTRTRPTHDSLPAWLDRDTWDAFLEMRSAKGKRAPFTDRAKTMMLGKLESLRAQGHDANECLRESVMNGWSGVFAPKLSPADTKTAPHRFGAQPPAAPTHWSDTRSGIERMGEELGLGRWDAGEFGVGRVESFAVYAARVKRKASAEGVR